MTRFLLRPSTHAFRGFSTTPSSLHVSSKENVVFNKILSDEPAQNLLTTWDSTLNVMRPKLSINWLNACAYLASESIPYCLFEAFASALQQSNPMEQIDAIAKLDHHFMLKIDKDFKFMSIHPFIQTVLQVKHSPEEKQKIIASLKLLCKRVLSESNDTTKEILRKHITVLENHEQKDVPLLGVNSFFDQNNEKTTTTSNTQNKP